MAARNYSNIAVETELASGIAQAAPTLSVLSAAGWPASPFLLVIEPDTANEEIVLVGNKAGTTFSSLTRGFGGTSDIAHNAASPVKHVTVAEDHSLIWSHVHSGAGGDDTAQVSHDNLTAVSVDDHHPQAHNVASHSDTDATGAELETLTGAGDADALHTHPAHAAAADPHPGYVLNAELTTHEAAADPHAPYALATEIWSLIYPVGSLYFQAGVATNPATLFGGGTWVAFGAGRVLVGFNAGDLDFDTLEETGGAKTHFHVVDPPFLNTGGPSNAFGVSSGAALNVPGDTHTHGVTIPPVNSATSSSLQPYIVVHIWKRTA